MFRLFCLPQFYRETLEPLRKHFKWSHFLTFSWLLLIIMLHHGPGNLAQIKAYMPLPYRFLTRFLASSYWYTQELWNHLLSLVLKSLPEPEDKICYVIADIVPFTGMLQMPPNAVNAILTPEKAKKTKTVPGSLGCIFW